MPKYIDLELKKAFLELHVKMIETSKKIQEIDSEIGTLNHVLIQMSLNKRGLSNLPEGTRTFEAIGRIFLLQDTESMKKRFAIRAEEVTLRVRDLIDKREYLEKNLKESEDNIREMVQLRKQQAEMKS